jgi:serine/threonine protein kinase/Tfp pilus assembly protein PilF
MNVSAGRRTWEEASSPAAVHLAHRYERAWRDSGNPSKRPDLRAFLHQAGIAVDEPGARLALLRADMMLRWEIGEKVGAQWYLDRYRDLGEDTIVALAYEEFCLREDDHESPDRGEYLARFPGVAGPLGRVLEIHELVGSGTGATVLPSMSAPSAERSSDQAFPDAGQSIAGFSLVEELGRGSFARVFLAREQQLGDRPVALKVAKRASHEPQTLARLQHTHIVPVHSERIDAETGLQLLCMPYFGRITLARLLADRAVRRATTGAEVLQALDRLQPAGAVPVARSAGRAALERRTYARSIAWWGARLADALEHAHERHVLHRDIKPSNVLVTSDGMPMLLDFNLARLPEPGGAADASPAAVGGTIDYMSPEHLRALADGIPDSLDGRADIYGLGVVLFEAVTGKRPFSSPRRAASVGEVLLRAADARYRPLPRLHNRYPDIPPALEAVIRRALAPEVADRYQSAAELSADLQGVADDLPLSHAREPWSSRAAGWLRRKRRGLAAATGILLAVALGAAVIFGLLVDRSKGYKQAVEEVENGGKAMEAGEYSAARVHFDSAVGLADRLHLSFWGYLAKLRNVRYLASQVSERLQDLPYAHDIDELKALAQEKSLLAQRTGRVRNQTDTLFDAADGLRFRLLLGEGSDLTAASLELQDLLAPFYVLENSDWINLEHTLPLLDPGRHSRLLVQVNELLFLWMAAIDESLAGNREGGNRPSVAVDQAAIERARSICERAIVWVERKAPWQALEARLNEYQSAFGDTRPAQGVPAEIVALPGEPSDVTDETSPLACYQWGLLCYRSGKSIRALDWLDRAARLESNNYWYQFMLAYLEDKAGFADYALNHYSVAVALKPESSGVRFSRARLYRSKGRWEWALGDLTSVLEKPVTPREESQVHLELGYLYQELGNFTVALSEYNRVIAQDQSGTYAKAARLNRANIAAESADFESARQEYDALLALDAQDTAARLSRGLLELRQNHPDRALVDLTMLLERKKELKNPDEVLAARAMAQLLLANADLAVADATEAQRLRGSPAHERLRQRALLAARRFESVELDRPADFGLLPMAGRRLRVDLRAAADGLDRSAKLSTEESYRAGLTRAVILAALGEHAAAGTTASRAIKVSPYSPRAYLIRARVRFHAGDHEGACSDVERGLAIQFNEPGLLELRGLLRAAAGDPLRALEDFNKALESANFDRTHMHKARALVSLGRIDQAVLEWSLALRRDPELPEAYLGRARAQMLLGRSDLALADLEQAASWAHADPAVEVGIVTAYFHCLKDRPDRARRWFALACRAARDVWGLVSEGAQIRAPSG